MRQTALPRAHSLTLSVLLIALGALVTTLSALSAYGASTPMSAATSAPRPSATEAAFIRGVATQLLASYPTERSALAAGYYRTTRLEPDGTIIYFNNRWNPTKLRPNFLWYDKNGKLVGLDYQYLVSGYPAPPGKSVFPVAANRWTTIRPHIHYAYRLPDGTVKRKGYKMLPDVQDNTLSDAQLRKAKLLPPGARLLWTYVHPKSWDLGFWLVPNPNGAFADLNPNVKP